MHVSIEFLKISRWISCIQYGAVDSKNLSLDENQTLYHYG